MKKKFLLSVMAIMVVTSSLCATQGDGTDRTIAAHTISAAQGDATGSILNAAFAAVELAAIPEGFTFVPTVTTQEPGAAGNRMWFWFEVDILGVGAGAEIALSNSDIGLFTLGLSGFFNFNYVFATLFADVTEPSFTGGKAFFRFFPGRSSFYLEVGFGFGHWSELLRTTHTVWDWSLNWGSGGWVTSTSYEPWTASSFMFAPAFGLRFGGETFFANPFISLPSLIGANLNVPFLPRFGIAIGMGL